MRIRRLLVLTLPMLSAACASATVGSDRMVLVDTDNAVHAQCVLENGHGRWVVARTPGVALVQGSRKDMDVSCTAPGGLKGHVVVESKLEQMSLGNGVLGGMLGTLTDLGSGASSRYDTRIVVPMSRD